MTTRAGAARDDALPSWVPQDARHYLEHTEAGQPIRALARGAQLHASTVLRQIRKVENARDDPLIDAALRSLSAQVARREVAVGVPGARKALGAVVAARRGEAPLPSAAEVALEAGRVLRRMTDAGAVLAMARDMDKAIVVREGPDGEPQRVAVVTREVAQALALKDWIASDDTGANIVRYRITGAGRTALKGILATGDAPAPGFAEAATPFAGAEALPEDAARAPMIESPLYGLARRRDALGTPFLDRVLVGAGERLREDYELSQMDPKLKRRVAALTDGVMAEPAPASDGSSAGAALTRVEAALFDLGPGLGDVALRACCLLEGMEMLEKRMGWSARSAKIVLRIALQRLQRHYFETMGQFAPRIG